MAEKRFPRVLVIGAGVAGLKAALELAESGVRVYLCDRKPYLGGTLVQLDHWFPDDHCGLCQVLPVFNRDRSSQYCLRRGLVHPNIELLPLTEVERVEGEAGDFRVTLKTRSSGVNAEFCTGCGLCETVCPVKVDDEFKLARQGAIHLRHPLALPRTYVIDWAGCTRCGACLKVCPTGAINLSPQDEGRELGVGAIILSTGFEEFDPLSATQYGYRRYPNVITSLEAERLLSPSGPSGGKLLRPSDGRTPASVAFLQCVGSRDKQRDFCSSACCLYAVKEAIMVKKASPDTRVSIFYMDLRAFGKGGYRYYQQAHDEHGIEFIRSRIPVVKQDFRTHSLLLTAANEDGVTTSPFEMVVLSVGQTPGAESRRTAELLGISPNQWGFCQTEEPGSAATTRKGIYVCGSASGPKDIPDALTESTAAAGEAASLVAPARPITTEPPTPKEEEPKIAVVLCTCGGQILKKEEAVSMAELCRGYGAGQVEEVAYLCHPETWGRVEASLTEKGISRAVLAACSSLEPRRAASASGGLELVNIREELAWVHPGGDKKVAEKASRLLAMALEKVRGQENISPTAQPVLPRALVIGGGLAGLTAARVIADRGFEVELVEKTGELGGQARQVYSLLDGRDPQQYLQNLIKGVEAAPLIHRHLNTEVVGVSGYAGNFRCLLRENSAVKEVGTGAIVIAAGAEESVPIEYLYGESERVLTQRGLEEGLSSGRIKPRELKSVAMIQCVGSREKARPYCSRICCSQALKNALALKRQNPETEVVVFYRDLMSYGFREEYYTRAREEGVLFVRYDPERKPEVRREGNEIIIRATEPALGEDILLKPDLLVLSPAIVPHNLELAHRLEVPLTEDGFFREAEVKFQPVDLLKEGIFVCGLAHSPRDIAETTIQAKAAAQRAVSLLARGTILPGRSVSEVNARRCRGCEICVKVCPYGARAKDLEKGIAVVREALCRGCGACAAACPSKAASLRELREKQVLRMLDAALS